MDPDLKRRWIAALRSGEYKQGWGALAALDENLRPVYCCLGVLCEVAGIDSYEFGSYEFEDEHYETGLVVDNEALVAEGKLMRHFGIPHDVHDDLTMANDGICSITHPERNMRPRTFEEIADWLESSDDEQGGAS